MDCFKAHLTEALYTRLTAVIPVPTDSGSFTFTGILPRTRRNWIAFDDLVFKPLSLTLSNSSMFKAFTSDLLSALIKQLRLPTATLQMSQLLASQLNTHKEALFTALSLHKDHLPAGGPPSSLNLAWLPLERPRKIPVSPVITGLRDLHPDLSQARCEELLRLHPTLGNYREQLSETLQQRSGSTSYTLPDPLYRAVTRAVFAARLERMLDGFYHPRAFNPDVDQWSRDLCTALVKHVFEIELVIVANAGLGTCSPDYRYSDSQLVINDFGGGKYAAYDRRHHGFMPIVSGPDGFFAALVATLVGASRAKRPVSFDPLTVGGWRKVVVEALNAVRTPDGFIDTDNPQVESYALPEVKWSSERRPDAKGIYTVDDVPGIVLDGKFYEVQSATDGVANSIIDRRRFARAPIPLLGNHAGTWRHVFERPMEWEGQYLFRRLGYSAAGFDSDQIGVILNVSNTTDEMLRRVHMNRERIPPLLSDTLQRFPRPHHVEISGDRTDPSVELIKRVFPGLSTSLAIDLVHSANELEIRQMRAGRVPLRLSEEARWYLREVRVNRAIEGLYLPDVKNNDSVKLMMHWLAKQPGWSTAVKVEVREGNAWGPLIGLLGADSATFQLTVLKTPQGWQVLSAPEQPVKASAQDLFTALLAALPDPERQALGHTYAGGADLLKEQLTLRAVENRDQIYAVLGMVAQRPWFKPPTRLADGRVGYSLSGRGSATSRFFADRIPRERYERIYPASAAGRSGRALQNMRARGLDVDQELARLEADARMLQQQITAWLAHKPDIETHDVAAQFHKQDMAVALCKAWRKETPALTDPKGKVLGYTMALEKWRVPTLPVLTVDFSHIRHLSMEEMRWGAGMAFGVDANLNQFLRCFPSLTSLKIEFCQLERFPEAIGQLSNLLELSLANSIRDLGHADQQALAGLVHLQKLNLSGCVLNARLDVRAMSELRELNLANTETVIWPQGVMQLAHLTSVDLRANHIITVPQEVLSGAEAINRVTFLQENELAPGALRQLQEYRARTGISFGLNHEADYPARLAFDDVVWLNGLDPDERQALYWQCQLLRDDPRAADFFKLIDELKTTADFELVKEDLVARVQNVLQAAAQGARVRDALFKLVSKPWTCCDATALLFSQLEIQVLVSKALADGDPERAELTLARIIRGKFRLEVLNSVAVEEARRQNRSAESLEIAFTYRLRLTEALALPAQPKNMRFPCLGPVESSVIEHARVDILAMDNGVAMLDYMTHDPMWEEFLRAQYADQFDAVYNANHKVVHGTDDYDKEGYERELKALQNRLTLTALARLNTH